MKKTAFAKWFVDGTQEQVERMVEEGAFYIQTFQSENDDNSNTIYSDSANTECNQVSGGKLDGSFEVIMKAETTNPVIAPGWNDGVEDCEYCRCLDDKGRNTGEAYDWGFLKKKATTTKTKKAKK